MDKPIEQNSKSPAIKRQVQVEAVAKAIYLITDLFDPGEPLRQALRQQAVETFAVSDKSQLSKSLTQIASMVRMAKEIGLISLMNSELLLGAIANIQTALVNKEQADLSAVLPQNIFVKDSEDGQGLIENVHPEVTFVTPTYVPETQNMKKTVTLRPEGGEIRQHEKEVTVTRERSTSVSLPGLDIGSRRKKILEIVRNKGQASINEFIEEIPGCSSKTIQRELTSLVLSGTLKKSGERRWSKYSLK